MRRRQTDGIGEIRGAVETQRRRKYRTNMFIRQNTEVSANKYIHGAVESIKNRSRRLLIVDAHFSRLPRRIDEVEMRVINSCGLQLIVISSQFLSKTNVRLQLLAAKMTTKT